MTTAAGFDRDFLDILKDFSAANVDFVVVGAHAMALHGVPRATGDLDLLVRPSPENASRVLSALEEFGAPLAAHGVTQADFETPDTAYQIGLPPRRIDIMTSISGVTFDEAWESRAHVDLDGMEVSFLGREALIRNKRSSGRDKDLVDLRLLTEGSAPSDDGLE